MKCEATKIHNLVGAKKSIFHDGGGEEEKEHFIKFQTVQHKGCVQLLCNLDGGKKSIL